MSDREYDGIDLTDIGLGVWISRVVNSDGHPVGVLEWHYCGGSTEEHFAAGSLLFDIQENAGQNRPKWTLVSDEPLTLHPSVLCRTCGLHGWIQQGRWVSA